MIQQASHRMWFRRRAEESSGLHRTRGRYVARDADYAIVTPAGSKAALSALSPTGSPCWPAESAPSVGRKLGSTSSRPGMRPGKLGQTPPESGTPLTTWPALSPAQVKNCMAPDRHPHGGKNLPERTRKRSLLTAWARGMWAAPDCSSKTLKSDSGPLVAELRAAEELITSMVDRSMGKAQLQAAAPAAAQPVKLLNPYQSPEPRHAHLRPHASPHRHNPLGLRRRFRMVLSNRLHLLSALGTGMSFRKPC